MNEEKAIISVHGLKNKFGKQWVHKGVSFDVKKGEIVAIIGKSGCGKTTLLNSILMLHKPLSGDITVFNTDVIHCSRKKARDLEHRWGVMFQNLALFKALSVWENIVFPVRRFTALKPETQKQLALLKIAMVGLKQAVASKYPSEISAGMAKKVALARAVALDPELVFLDDSTAGLDPINAHLLNNIILELRDILNITVILVTQNINTLFQVSDRVLFLGEGKVLGFSPIKELVNNPHPLIQSYFSDERQRYGHKN